MGMTFAHITLGCTQRSLWLEESKLEVCMQRMDAVIDQMANMTQIHNNKYWFLNFERMTQILILAFLQTFILQKLIS